MKYPYLFTLILIYSLRFAFAQDSIFINHVNIWSDSILRTNILIESNVLYSTTINNKFQIHVLDGQNNFILQGECTNVDGTNKLLVKDTLAYAICNQSISIINISNFNSPQVLFNYKLPQDDIISKADVNDSILVYYSGLGLSILDIKNSLNPLLIYHDTIYYGYPTLYKDILYLSHAQGVDVLDITNPSKPLFLTSFADTFWWLSDFFVRNDTVLMLRNWCISMSTCFSGVLVYKRMPDNSHVLLYERGLPDWANYELDVLKDLIFVDAGNYILDLYSGKVVGRIFYDDPGYKQTFFISTEHLYCGQTNLQSEYETIDIMEYTIITSVNNNNFKDNEYFIAQNYPNPFNPTTKIRYSVPYSGFVQIKVYDLLGKEIKTLLNECKNSGTYEIVFDGSDLSSGLYCYSISFDGVFNIRKMLLLK